MTLGRMRRSGRSAAGCPQWLLPSPANGRWPERRAMQRARLLPAGPAGGQHWGSSSMLLEGGWFGFNRTAEVGGPGAFVLKKRIGCPLEHDAPGFDHVAALRAPQRFRDVLLDQQYRDAARVDLRDRVEDRLHQHRREPERRLVEHEKPRLQHQASADRDHLLLAA